MSLFRRKDEPGADTGSTTIPAARDPDLAVPPFRPAAATQPAGAAPAVGPAAPKPNAPPATAAGVTRVAGAAPTPPASTAPRAPAAQPERRTLVVGKGISLQGTVTEAERLVIEGTMESQLLQAQELVITHAGVFKGEVQVEDAEIAGTFDGSITATGSLVIRSTGRLLGTARTRKLSVEEGGQVSGKMEMLSDGAPQARLPLAPARTSEPADA
ncbi:cytoskeletal protein CcmA (bactofilin family) [Roseomonas alkaliterrae]|uniref:Cytoskeletal protein CcmA (Bactofilin family) n=2 Tax=Neoroseomonas alkaliterrae TaxID=1452450 RepID=A0A840XWG1_9PROT|nr:polymer-forming cytoskeletal protein [Neoroseomonas alkaliterrae]MBB5688181.1 cytoskeletal protein CcmA (bactofilin family) [Neoroseomonas alkaliterrae]